MMGRGYRYMLIPTTGLPIPNDDGLMWRQRVIYMTYQVSQILGQDPPITTYFDTFLAEVSDLNMVSNDTKGCLWECCKDA